MDFIIREIAESMDLDPDKVANSIGEAAVQAEILKKFQEQNPPPAPAVDPNAAPAAPTGGAPAGGMGTGSAPVPGEQGFSGNTGEGMPPEGL
tara:strand:- start:147 stop:422 length:276 start_codon:yes stop_codon:yes gene_type:complete